MGYDYTLTYKEFQSNIGNKTGGLCPRQIGADPIGSTVDSAKSDQICHQLADSPPNFVRQPDLKLSSASWRNRSAADLFRGQITNKKI